MDSFLRLFCLFFFSTAITRKRFRGEIAIGDPVDYSTIKTSYPFMARLVMDAAYRCGGAVVSDRYTQFLVAHNYF